MRWKLRATLTADVALSVAKGKEQSEKGVDSTTLTYTLSNKGPGDAPGGKVHVALVKGAAFGSLPRSAATTSTRCRATSARSPRASRRPWR
ncbi:hypothetical protein ACU686_40155 [Yinghuangia aomiensis]